MAVQNVQSITILQFIFYFGRLVSYLNNNIDMSSQPKKKNYIYVIRKFVEYVGIIDYINFVMFGMVTTPLSQIPIEKKLSISDNL